MMQEPEPLPPLSQVRTQILAQHVGLRRRLAQLDELAAAVLAGQTELLMELRRQTVDLELTLLAHLAFEEKHLLPRLVGIDAWGGVRAAAMQADHARQRQVLSEAGDNATSAAQGPEALGKMVRALVADLLADMDREEKDLLSPDLLRDDIVVIDQSDG
ncbi:MAG: hemerythrin domain-containing protein [Myxococcales bacterium]|nr:hemerythrin domain-containing protein [Myxococcota bacterium]MDW8280178.1 hemerythrin domain-containing protein [Myxococcales bacterium]